VRDRWTGSQALGTAWEHAMVVEPEHFSAAIRYIVDEQEDAMAGF
jgi:hypothetical protein